MSSSWADRPSDDTIRAVIAAARAEGLIGPDAPAAVFHDIDLFERRLDELLGAFDVPTLHALAVKANPLVALLRIAVDRGIGLEAASIEEVHVALAAGCPPDRIVFDSPAKTAAELSESLALGVRVNADNFDELRRVIRLRRATSTSVVGLRVNPLIGEGSIPITSVGGRTSKFGEPLDGVLEPLAELAAEHPWITGLHSHIGSQGVGIDAHVAAARVVADLRDRLHDRLGRPQFDQVDLGGGATTDYVGETPVVPRRFAGELVGAAPSLFDGSATIVTEFGRAIQANCGWAWSAVEYVKRTDGRPNAVIHLGADFLLRPVYQPEHWRHRISSPNRPPSGGDRWMVSGPLCFAGDVLGHEFELGDLRPGDDVVVHDVGAYTLSMWSRHCSRGIPAVIGYRIDDGTPQLTVLRARETPADVAAFWSPPAS